MPSGGLGRLHVPPRGLPGMRKLVPRRGSRELRRGFSVCSTLSNQSKKAKDKQGKQASGAPLSDSHVRSSDRHGSLAVHTKNFNVKSCGASISAPRVPEPHAIFRVLFVQEKCPRIWTFEKRLGVIAWEEKTNSWPAQVDSVCHGSLTPAACRAMTTAKRAIFKPHTPPMSN